MKSPLNEFWDETVHGEMPLNYQCLPLEYKPTLSFDISCDKYIEIFNKLMSARFYAFNFFEKKIHKGFKNSYMFKRHESFNTLGLFKPKRNIKYSGLILMGFNKKDLRANPSQEGMFDAEQFNDLTILQLVMGSRHVVSLHIPHKLSITLRFF